MSDVSYVCKVAFAAGPGLAYRAEVLADDPVLYLRLGESSGATAQDETANNNAGTYTNTPTLGAPSALEHDANSAVDFDSGSSEYIRVTDSASLDVGDTFTLELWLNADSFASTPRLMHKGNPGIQWIVTTAGQVQLQKSGVGSIAPSTINLSVDTWHHVVVTKSGATTKIYIDAVDRTGTVTNQTIENTAVDLFIGASTGAANTFDGTLDEVAIYPTALTAARVKAHYEAGKPTWTNLSTRLMGFQVRRGRQKELDRIDAGTATFRFKNSDRHLDPTHDGSPYSPNVLPMRRIRLLAEHNAVTYDLFHGFVEAWPQTWEGPNVGFTEITATDAFLPLSKADVGENETWPREFSGQRINRVLDAAGWPAADRAIDAGHSTIAATAFALGSGVTALDHIREVAGAELGAFFVDGRGYAIFHDRHHRKAASYLTSQGTFGDALSGGLPYQTVVLDTDADRIWNDVQVTAHGGETQRSQDAASQTKYLRRTLARQVPLERDAEAVDQADYLLRLYSEPRNRLAGITITPTTDALWAQALGRELADHITVKRWPQGVGGQIVQECSIESTDLRWSANPGVTRASWLLSTPAYTGIDWWILGDATYGVLGSTTKVVY